MTQNEIIIIKKNVENIDQRQLVRGDYLYNLSIRQSTVGKKMAGVHFTTIPCDPNTAYKAQRKPNFCNVCPCIRDIVYARFEDFIALLCVFMNVVNVFVR